MPIIVKNISHCDALNYGDVQNDTEDKSWWQQHVSHKEVIFVRNICPL